ncbi:hypothetical protein PNP85_01985 [Halobacterium salinarum]|uniref:hypothetical protein n=1 Tax=Halobacterium salinarum TaxID=2242 RepID=UPI0025520FA7|nr:hypothetical protein [Halobacterium salinarum]MDL0121108.1 hypothetical protein [Halobacterium salinarum]MDL0135789.1 hypothetical protein [Halobacterium salinarum]MDL0138279.1 hypothetical protein [Halobacterium salinarum]
MNDSKEQAIKSTTCEFTYDWYRNFLQGLNDADRNFTTYDGEIETGDVLLRHDVDLSVERAVRMAEIEAAEGVQATYFLLVTTKMYNLLNDEVRERVSRIRSLGHNIGLHFSTHQYYEEEPRTKSLVKRIEIERQIFKMATGIPVDTVSFHIPPDWVLRQSFDDFVSTYEERFFSEISYRGDSNQRWRNDPPFDSGYPEKLQILVHPGLWGENDREFEDCVHRAVDNVAESVDTFANRQYIEDELSG